jgi:hypothetical protein
MGHLLTSLKVNRLKKHSSMKSLEWKNGREIKFYIPTAFDIHESVHHERGFKK